MASETTYTLKLIEIEQSGSIGRDLKATINGVSIGFAGPSTRHRIIAANVPLPAGIALQIDVNVVERDAKTDDEPYYGGTNMVIGPNNPAVTTGEATVDVTEVGGRGRNKGKKATFTFHFQTVVKSGFDVTDIPPIMIANSWPIGAAMLNRWFSRPAGVQPGDTDTIKMNWVLGYPRAKAVYDELVNKTLQNKKVISLIKKKYAATTGAFGKFSSYVEVLRPDHIQHKEVEEPKAVDDLFAALGHFSIYVVVKGVATKDAIGITHLGLFVYDSFDFEGHQFLGFWDKATNYGGFYFKKGSHEVDNGDFRDYRTRTGEGADYLIYSDLSVVKLASAVTILK